MTYTYTSEWSEETTELTLRKCSYSNNGRLAVQALDSDGFPYMMITVNIVDYPVTDKDCAFVDTNNCGIGIVDWLESNGIAKRTGHTAHSGFCTYPEMRFTL